LLIKNLRGEEALADKQLPQIASTCYLLDKEILAMPSMIFLLLWCPILFRGAATKPWILQRLRRKTVFELLKESAIK
jgi:hypothetical protein